MGTVGDRSGRPDEIGTDGHPTEALPVTADVETFVTDEQRHHRPGRPRLDRLPDYRASADDHPHARNEGDHAWPHGMDGRQWAHFAAAGSSRMKMFRQRISPPWVCNWIGPFSGTGTARS
jgi:hypothetical protein